MESDNTRHVCVYAHMALVYFGRFELTLLEIQTLDFVLQRGGLQGEICHALVAVALRAWYGTSERDSTASVPRIP